MNNIFLKNYAKQYRRVFLFFAVTSLVVCLSELFLTNGKQDWVYIMMLLALSVSFFIEAEYPHIYQFGTQVKKMPVNMQILLTLCYFILVMSLIIKLMV